MCYFITIGVPESMAGQLEEQARPAMSAWQCENKHIMAHCDPNFDGYVLTTGMCSWDLYSEPFGGEAREEHARRLQEKYRKKGWSEAKIKRAIADATAVEKARGLRADTRELIARMADASGRVYVFVHMYSGNQMTEKVGVKHGPIVPSAEFRSGAYVLECDTLVTVKGQGYR